jgi:starvation-inducible DNA-binding protein
MPTTLTKTHLSRETVNTGITDDHREGIVETLNALLADEFVLYSKTRKYHWNVVGPRFHDLHIFFEKQYGELDELMDSVAENVRQFGGAAAATLQEYSQRSRLKEEPGVNPDAEGMVSNLLKDHESIIRELRHDIDRAADEFHAQDAADFLTSVLEAHNKMAWMLRSTVTKQL